jgi:hypothetical protein
MRQLVVVSMIALSACSSGCALLCDATSLMVFKVRESVEDCHESVRNHKWAEEAWVRVRAGTPGAPYSKDYAQGFKDGFAYFLFHGGTGEPPALPPSGYRKVAYQTPQGYQAIEDWFAGYRHGASVARESGYRQWVTGPSALRGQTPIVPAAGPEPATMIPPPPPVPEAPLPQPTPLPRVDDDVPTGTPPTPVTTLAPVHYRDKPGGTILDIQALPEPPPAADDSPPTPTPRATHRILDVHGVATGPPN